MGGGPSVLQHATIGPVRRLVGEGGWVRLRLAPASSPPSSGEDSSAVRASDVSAFFRVLSSCRTWQSAFVWLFRLQYPHVTPKVRRRPSERRYTSPFRRPRGRGPCPSRFCEPPFLLRRRRMVSRASAGVGLRVVTRARPRSVRALTGLCRSVRRGWFAFALPVPRRSMTCTSVSSVSRPSASCCSACSVQSFSGWLVSRSGRRTGTAGDVGAAGSVAASPGVISGWHLSPVKRQRPNREHRSGVSVGSSSSPVVREAHWAAACAASLHGLATTWRRPRVMSASEPGDLVVSAQGVHTSSAVRPPAVGASPRITVARARAHATHGSLRASCGWDGRGGRAPRAWVFVGTNA